LSIIAGSVANLKMRTREGWMIDRQAAFEVPNKPEMNPTCPAMSPSDNHLTPSYPKLIAEAKEDRRTRLPE
jgi:hypothetical protein